MGEESQVNSQDIVFCFIQVRHLNFILVSADITIQAPVLFTT